MEKKSYDWRFAQVGGVTRVKIETGDDTARRICHPRPGARGPNSIKNCGQC